MSADIVDDLHEAEDHIGVLEALLYDARLALSVQSGHRDWLVDRLSDDEKAAVTRALNSLDEPIPAYERPSCDEDCDNEFCGSPRHYDQTFNEDTGEWEDNDE